MRTKHGPTIHSGTLLREETIPQLSKKKGRKKRLRGFGGLRGGGSIRDVLVREEITSIFAARGGKSRENDQSLHLRRGKSS